MIGIAMAALLWGGSEPSDLPSSITLRQVTITSYGPEPAIDCGVLSTGRFMTVTQRSEIAEAAGGSSLELVMACGGDGKFNGQPVPAVGSVCDIVFRFDKQRDMMLGSGEPSTLRRFVSLMTCR